MRIVSNTALALAAALAVVAWRPGVAAAQAPDTMTKRVARTGGAIDSGAMNALNRMGVYLRTLQAFQVKGRITSEEVLPTGEKIQFGSDVDLVAERPNKLRADVNSDREHRLFIYDGKTFTLYAPRAEYYATAPAPATINDLANRLEDKFNINLPFVDLFRWGTPEADPVEITSAADVGPSMIEGVTCQHYAFRQRGLDWQIWIQNGEFPLPRKLVLTTTTDDARPQHVSVYTWNLAPSVNAAAYAFQPPKDAKKITFAEVGVGKTAAKAVKETGR
jgi:hypothetical protein